MIPFSFVKMHGLGNDFVVLDAFVSSFSIGKEEAKIISDRRFGIGCDQILIVKPSEIADAEVIVINSDGSKSDACGNGARCIISYLAEKLSKNTINIIMGDRFIAGQMISNSNVKIDMGAPDLRWDLIPLSREMNTLHLNLDRYYEGDLILSDPVAVGMGNPHVVFFVKDINLINLEMLGPTIENDEIFPNRVNVSVASVEKKNFINLKVWERGVGLTLACGSGACATFVGAVLRNLVEKKSKISLPGGLLEIEWLKNDHISVEGEAVKVYEGYFNEF